MLEKPTGLFADHAMETDSSDVKPQEPDWRGIMRDVPDPTFDYCKGFNHGLILAEAKLEEMLVNSVAHSGKVAINPAWVASIERENKDLLETRQDLIHQLNDMFKWFPRRTDPIRAGWYYVREVQPRLCVGIRYFDDTKAEWWAVSKDGKNDGSLVPNETFHDWLSIPNITDRQGS